MPRKVVVYMGDRRIYNMLEIAAKSLLDCTDVDQVYFLIDDPIFPFLLPDIIRCINVRDQKYFRIPGPNYHRHYGYMTLMRAALSKILPDEDLVLLLDPDTIVFRDISAVWDYDVSDYYFAAVEETRFFNQPHSIHSKVPYFNAGVMLVNLAKMRTDKIDDAVIASINAKHYEHLEQDVLNFVCDKHILSLPATYNCSFVSDPVEGEPCIRHFLSYAKPEWKTYAEPYTHKRWNEIMKGDKHGR